MIAGTGSGCGKTTVTCALLSALAGRNIVKFIYVKGRLANIVAK